MCFSKPQVQEQMDFRNTFKLLYFLNKPYSAIGACNQKGSSRCRRWFPFTRELSREQCWWLQIHLQPGSRGSLQDLLVPRKCPHTLSFQRFDMANCFPSANPRNSRVRPILVRSLPASSSNIRIKDLRSPSVQLQLLNAPETQSLGITLPLIHIPAVFHCLLNVCISGNLLLKMKLCDWKRNSEEPYPAECDYISVFYH